MATNNKINIKTNKYYFNYTHTDNINYRFMIEKKNCTILCLIEQRKNFSEIYSKHKFSLIGVR